MKKYTLGPWAIEETEDTIFILASGKCDAQIASIELGSEIVICHDETGPHEAKSNAHLISAAPDMLEALENFVNQFEIGILPRSACEQAKIAIKKAKGE